MLTEALCVAGGSTSVVRENWLTEKSDKAWVLIPRNEVTVSRGLCIAPSECPFAQRCTRKVTFSVSEDNGFSQAIIHTVRFPDEVPEEITGEDGDGLG